jgi:hypothetical protein
MRKKSKKIQVEKSEKKIPVKKPGKLRRLAGNFGKLALDVAKLIFASLVLGTIIRGGFTQATLITAGIIVSSASAVVGLVLVAISEE